jgi:hypothetical protein
MYFIYIYLSSYFCKKLTLYVRVYACIRVRSLTTLKLDRIDSKLEDNVHMISEMHQVH